MLDQRQANSLSKALGAIFIALGIIMSILGISLLFSEGRSEIETILLILFLLSGGLMLIGGFQNIRNARDKDKAVDWYEAQLRIKDEVLIPNKMPLPEITNLAETTEKKSIQKNTQEQHPDIIAKWEYTKSEWRTMTKAETMRRFKEGIWVSLFIGILGGWIISKTGESYLFGFLFALTVGVFISWLKVKLSNNLFALQQKNSIWITTNALIINYKFKNISDYLIHLKYVKALKVEAHQYLEFSLEWQTRNGVTNDQIRILVPERYNIQIQMVLDYFERVENVNG